MKWHFGRVFQGQGVGEGKEAAVDAEVYPNQQVHSQGAA